MSNTVEDQVVGMHFDNKQFESGVAQSLGTLDKLKSAMSFSGAGKGIDDINRSVSGFNMNPMQAAIEGISGKWLALSTIAVTAISNITNKVVDSALKIGKSLVVDPFTQGYGEYSTNLNSIQTIIANTGAKLPAVNKVLAQLNTYSDKTIYNFGQMAQNIGRFTAAGVAMGPAVDAIKGMANTAALSGATADQLNSAMYQMSQALSTGVIRLMDWNSLANANMGGQNIQKALQATAMSGDDAGKAMQDAVAKAGNFRDSLTEGWLTGDIFTKTMKVMAGQIDKTTGGYKAFTVAQLQGMGYSAEAAKELNGLSKRSIDAATKVKTLSQAFDVVKESIGSGWAQVFQNIFGNFNQSKKLWTGVTKYITDAVGGFFAKINKALLFWNKFGGRVAIIEGLKQAFKDLLRFFVPIKNAFKEVFPPGSAKVLITISEAFHSFFELFRLNIKQMHAIRVVFVGIFTAIKFLATIVGFAFKVIGNLFGLLSSGVGKGGGFLDTIVETVASFIDWVREGKKLEQMLKGVSKVASAFFKALQPLVPIIQSIGDSIANLVSEGGNIAKGMIDGIIQGINGASIQAALVSFANNIVIWIKNALGIHSPATTMIPIGINIVQGIVSGLTQGLQFLIGGLQKVVSGIGQGLKSAVANLDWGQVLATINTALHTGFLLVFLKFIYDFDRGVKSFKKIMGAGTGVLNQLTSNLKTMQNKVRAEIIRSIAVSILLLAGATLLLASIDSKKLVIALSAIGGLMAALTTSMKIVAGGDLTGTSVKDVTKKSASLVALGTAMVLFSTSIVILAGAVAIMGKLDPKTMEQGLKGVGAVVAGVVAATAILSKTGGGATLFATASALIVLSAALVAFVGVMKIYSKLDWNLIIDGGGKAAAVILGVGLAMRGFGKYAISGSVGLVIASAALLILAKAMTKFAAIGLSDMIKTTVALTVILTMLAAAALVMSVAEGGAAGMLIMATAIVILAKALEILAKISVGNLVKAIIAMDVALAIIAATAVALLPAVPAIDAMGAALLLFGAAVALAGLGALAFATAIGILAVVGPAGFQAVHDGILQMLDVLPQVAKAAGAFVLQFIQGFVEAAGPLTTAIFKLLTIIANAFIKFQPKFQEVVRAFIDTIFTVLESYVDRFVRYGVHVVLALAQGIIDTSSKLITKGKELVIAIITGLGKAAVDIADATGRTILNVLNGFDDAIVKYSGPIRNAGLKIAFDLIDGMTGGILTYGMDKVRSAAEQLANALPGWMQKVLGINSPSTIMRDEVGKWAALGVSDGISQHIGAAEKSSEALANKSLDAMRYAFNNSRKMGDSLRDIRPTIAPVLDLTQLEKDAMAISGHLSGKHMINTGLTGRKAADISGLEGRRRADAVASINETYNFNQTINSPKPVNKVDVYRGTKSQFALFKEVKGS